MIKNILTYYFISFLFTIYDVLIVRKVDLALKDILVLSLIPGMLIEC